MTKREMIRFHRNRQLVHCTYVYLACFILDILRALSQHYENPTEDLQRKLHEVMADYFGNDERDGRLQNSLNKAYNNVLHQLKKDFPSLTRKHVPIFSYYAVGLPVPVMHILGGISSQNSVCVMKTQMTKRIQAKSCSRQEEYLMLMKREKLPNWVRNAIFA